MAPDPQPTATGSQVGRDNSNHRTSSATHPKQRRQQQQQLHEISLELPMNEQESAIASGIALPVRELEYDDRVDYAADVSVMESLGGPSLLVKRIWHDNAVYYGADRANYENLDRQDPELADLVAQYQGVSGDEGQGGASEV